MRARLSAIGRHAAAEADQHQARTRETLRGDRLVPDDRAEESAMIGMTTETNAARDTGQRWMSQAMSAKAPHEPRSVR